MKEQLSFFNFSLKKVVALEPDSFKKAKLKIVYTVLLLSIIKVLIILPVSIQYGQYRQFFRAGLLAAFFFVLLKVLLYKPGNIKVISHLLLSAAILVIWSNFLFYSQNLSTIVIQLIMMTTLMSYYLLGGVQAGIYTCCAVLPLVVYITAKDFGIWHLDIVPERLGTPLFDLIVVLNFLTMVINHYLFYKTFHENLREKEVLNQQLLINIKEAKALAESRTVFLSTMSHELRTPLNGVIGMTHLLKDTAQGEQNEYLNILEFSANNLLSMINDVLDFNKSELDKIELEAFPVNLAVLLRKICAGLKMKAAEKSLSFNLKIDQRLEQQLLVTDPTRLTQVIYNLAGNAIKFTEQGIVGVIAEVIDVHDGRAEVKFSIYDTGIGIAAERQNAIFDPFTQASTDTTRKYGGSGLGLAIVKRLLKLFGSDIKLDSQPGKGSSFTFTIPFLLHKEDIKLTVVTQSVKSSMGGIKLLIVEDNPINVLLLQRLLAKWEVKTSVAVNGEEALKIWERDSFDGILMDLHMPVMDGYEAAIAIRACKDVFKANIPIIAVTASVSHNVLSKINEAGMQDYLPKPFHADLLYEKLQLFQDSEMSYQRGLKLDVSA